jgi:putative oxidoreductase
MFARWLSSRVEESYTLMRALLGLMWAFHGLQKLFGFLSDFQPPPFSQLWIGAVIEVVAGPLIAIGLWTRAAAFLASGTMAVAYVQFHWKLDFGRKFFPDLNEGELSLVYALVFLFIACQGAGRYSVDALRGRAHSR